MTHKLTKAMEALGLSISAVFVPWSQSRNFDKDKRPNERSLNWKVTLHHTPQEAFARGVTPRAILETDYGAGVGHCPSYKAGARWTLDYSALIEFETENGRKANALSWGITKGAPIMPKAEDVLASLALDAGAIDFATYEEWARDYGYDEDSRKGVSIYRACLEIGLKLRAALGDAGLQTLRDAASEW